MKKIFFSMALLAISAGFTACSDDDDEEVVAEVASLAGTYTGYSDVSCAYFTEYYTDDESVVISEDNTITYTSSTWGTCTIDIVVDGNSFTGEGSFTMKGNEYDATVEGTITSTSDFEITFSVPSVMGGVKIVLRPGTAPVAEEEEEEAAEEEDATSGATSTTDDDTSDADEVEAVSIVGTYTGDAAMTTGTGMSMTLTEQVLTITETDGVYSISYTYGQGSAEAVLETTEGDDAVTISGTGTYAGSYAVTVSGTIKNDKSDYEITVEIAEAMGGITLVFTPAATTAE